MPLNVGSCQIRVSVVHAGSNTSVGVTIPEYDIPGLIDYEGSIGFAQLRAIFEACWMFINIPVFKFHHVSEPR